MFIARPGSRVAGNVTFGNADDTFVTYDTTSDVSGTIDGGGGTNTFARAYTTSTTVAADAALPTNFQRVGIGAIGPGTVVTVTKAAAGLTTGPLFLGDGQIVNEANVNPAGTGPITTRARIR